MKLTIVRMTIELCSPLHIGSGLASPDTDAPVIRDAFGDYRIPGSSIAGALRAFTDSTDPVPVWGEARERENAASSIEVSDGFLVDWDGKSALQKRLRGEPVRLSVFPEVQDHVCIDHESGTAVEGGKFDSEIVPQGIRFRIELAFADRGGLGVGRPTFDSAVAALACGQVALGGDVASGLGLVHIVAGSGSIAVFDLSDAKGLEAACRRSSDIDLPASDSHSAWTASTPSAPSIGQDNHGTLTGTVKIRFRTDGPILVGGSQRPSTNSSATADLVFGEVLVADYAAKRLVARPLIPGSSLRGAIRGRVRVILDALANKDSEGEIGCLFGSIAPGVGGEDAPRASKVRIGGAVLEPQPRTLVQHVAIDRLTGGSLRGALYSEAPIWQDGLSFIVTIQLDRVELRHAAALAHAVIDMGTGDLPIGGGTRRGNGRLLFHSPSEAPSDWHSAVSYSLSWSGQTVTEKCGADERRKLWNALDGAWGELVGGGK